MAGPPSLQRHRLILILALSSAPASAASLCPGLGLARLAEQGSCRARFELREGTLCFGEKSWVRSLDTEACYDLGRWRVSSRLENGEDHRRPMRKEIRLRLLANGWATEASGFFSRVRGRFERLRLELSLILRPQDEGGWIRGLVLNERAGIDPGFLRQLGLVHLLTATGIHLYVLSSHLTTAAGHLLVLLGVTPARAVGVGRALGGVAWLWAWALAGLRPGMLRPLLLVFLRGLALRLGIRWKTGATLFLALAIDLVWALHAEESLLQPGRWHYAFAVAGGILGARAFSGRGSFMLHFGLALGSWAFLAVVDAWETQRVAVFTPILSLVSIPIFCTVFYPLCLLASLVLSASRELAVSILVPISDWTNEGVKFLAGATLHFGGVWWVDRHAVLAGAVLAALFLAIRGRARLLLFLPVVMWSLPGFRGDSSFAQSVEQLDVGQGDSAVVRTRGGAGLVDLGSARALRPSDWLEILSSRGITELSWIALTHLDEDHAGGIHVLARLLPIACVSTSSEELGSARGRSLGIPLEPWERGCFPFFSLGPSRARGRRASGNARMSAVLIPLADGRKYLSMGDADHEQEARFVKELRRRGLLAPGDPLILKVSHHGSRFSTSRGLLRQLNPIEAWVSAGVGNHYGHPTAQAIDNIRSEGIPLRRTDLEGSLRSLEQ